MSATKHAMHHVLRRRHESAGTLEKPEQAQSGGEYVFMQTDFQSDGLGSLLPMISPPTFLLEAIDQQDM